MNIGKSTKIALAMKEKKPSWLAEQLGVSRQRANDILNSPKSNTETIERLCKVFNMTASDFVALGEKESD